jgi:hypothetical protein
VSKTVGARARSVIARNEPFELVEPVQHDVNFVSLAGIDHQETTIAEDSKREMLGFPLESRQALFVVRKLTGRTLIATSRSSFVSSAR